MARRRSARRVARSARQDLPWVASYYVEEDGSVPAREALCAGDTPRAVRIALLARVVAVRDYPPPSFPTGSPIWSLMSRDPQKGKVDMSGIFEIRDKHGPLLYRLFCVLDSEASEHGVEDARVLALLSLGIKPERTRMPERVYRQVRRQADRYFATSPRPILWPPPADV
jgi:hypothetical protein